MQSFTKFLALASTSPPSPCQKKGQHRIRGYGKLFDDLTINVAAPQLFPVGDYHGIAYGGVVVLRPTSGAASILPHPPPQQAGAAGPIDLLQLGSVTLNTYATMTRNSTIQSFDLQSFYFGFGTDAGTTAGLAQAGTLTSVVGYNTAGDQLPVQTYSHVPGSTLDAQKIRTGLSASYVNLQNVTLAVAKSEPVTERTYIALDNVRDINKS